MSALRYFKGLESFVGDTLHLIIQERENRAAEAKEQALKDALALGPEVDIEDDFSQG